MTWRGWFFTDHMPTHGAGGLYVWGIGRRHRRCLKFSTGGYDCTQGRALRFFWWRGVAYHVTGWGADGRPWMLSLVVMRW
jgi:hypothetical protein